MRSAPNFHPDRDLKYQSRAKLHPETIENIARAERGEMHAHLCFVCNTVYEDHCTLAGYELRCQECRKPYANARLKPIERHPHKCCGCGDVREDRCEMPAYFVQCDTCSAQPQRRLTPREELAVLSEAEREEFEEWRRQKRLARHDET